MIELLKNKTQQNWNRELGTEVGFWQLANGLVIWVGVTLFLLQQWFLLS